MKTGWYKNAQAALVSCLCVFSVVQAQIANIESRRIVSDTTGWDGRWDIGGSFSRNNGRKFMRFNTALQSQYKTQKDLFLVLTQYDIVKAGEEDFVNTGFVHLRYNRKLNKHIRWEAFIQAQYNQLLKQRIRYLSGTGPRFKLASGETLHLYLGTLYMYEYEEEAVDPLIIHRDHRLSSYLSFTWDPTDHIAITSTCYYQPLLRDFRDWRLSGNLRAEMKVAKRASLRVEANLINDTRPPAGVDPLAYSVTTGISLKLK